MSLYVTKVRFFLFSLFLSNKLTKVNLSLFDYVFCVSFFLLVKCSVFMCYRV